jgi:hypothetical protein
MRQAALRRAAVSGASHQARALHERASERSVLGLADHLALLGVTRVIMEATGDYVRRDGA